MGVKLKRSFTLIEVMVSMLLLGFLIIASMSAYSFIIKSSKLNQIRYLVLNKIDTEMNRVVFAYENLDTLDFVNVDFSTNDEWDRYFDVPVNVASDSDNFRAYIHNPLEDPQGILGLYINNLIHDTQKNNIVEILDKNNNPNIVDDGDIVGLLAWKYESDILVTPRVANISLSITYPYKAKFDTSNNALGNDSYSVHRINNFDLETVNIKTSTNIKN